MEKNSWVRISFACYNNHNDIERLVSMLHRITAGDYAGHYVQDRATGEYTPSNYTEPLADYFML